MNRISLMVPVALFCRKIIGRCQQIMFSLSLSYDGCCMALLQLEFLKKSSYLGFSVNGILYFYRPLIRSISHFSVGVGGYTYLLEPLWWVGMVTSKCCTFIAPFVVLLLHIMPYPSLIFLGLMNCLHDSDFWGGLKFCSLCICSGSLGDTPWCIKHNN